MPDTLEQNLANHAKFDPPFHFVLMPIMLANVIVSIMAVVHNPGMGTGWCLVLAIAALASGVIAAISNATAISWSCGQFSGILISVERERSAQAPLL